MTSPLANINDACFDPRARFRFSNFRIGREDIPRMRSALGDTTWAGFLALVAHGCQSVQV